MPNLRVVGREAEDRAAEFLIQAGYTIVTRRFKVLRGEIDLVALDGDVLVFVEVKARFTPGYDPTTAVGPAKRKALFRAGQAYLQHVEEPDREIRFDLVAIDPSGIQHLQDILGRH